MFKKVASLVVVLGLAAPVMAQTEAAGEAKAPKTEAHGAKKAKAKGKKEAAAAPAATEAKAPAPAEAAHGEAAPAPKAP